RAPIICTATSPTEIYARSLHDALPISDGSGDAPLAHQDLVKARRVATAEQLGEKRNRERLPVFRDFAQHRRLVTQAHVGEFRRRSEEHTSELQSRRDLVCRLLLEKKKI